MHMRPRILIARLLAWVERESRSLAISRVDPRLHPPSMASRLLSIIEALAKASLVAAVSSPLILAINTEAGVALAGIALLLVAAAYALPRLARAAVGMGVDRELPGLLAYLLPYASSARHLVDVMADLRVRGLRWSRLEAERLRYLLDLGHDPLSALRELASTTPSGKLRRALLEYVHSLEIGASRSQVTLRLLQAAIEELRAAWRSYTDLGRAIVEAVTTLVIAGVALAPVALLSGSMDPSLLVAPLIASPAAALLLVVTRPSIGDARIGLAPLAIVVLGTLASAGAALTLGLPEGIALQAAVALASEVVGRRYAAREERAYQALREAADAAKYGGDLEEKLRSDTPLASGVVGAIIEATRIAGRLGVSEAVAHISRLVEEARGIVAQLRGQALLLAAIAAAAPAMAVYILASIASMASGGAPFAAGDPRSLSYAAGLIASASPLAPLPAAVLQRGWRPSGGPSLVAIAASALVAYETGLV